MVYLGSKNKLAKYIVPIIQKYIDDTNCKDYFEPFVGGANIIDKIKCENKYGNDINKYLIALLEQAQRDVTVFPDEISEEEYKRVRDNKNSYEDWYVGLVGFCSTFGGKFFNGYARSVKNDGKTIRNMSNERIKNLINQSSNLKDICFFNESFLKSNNLSGYVIYCDPPYKGTTKYATSPFPHDDFYDWCVKQSKNNIVLVNEYNMPDNFECIWRKETKANFDSNRQNGIDTTRIEKLFICKGE